MFNREAYEEEMRAEENARYDSVYERYAGSAPDPETEYRYAMMEEEEETARLAAEAGMTVDEYLEDIRRKAEEREATRRSTFSDDEIPF